MKINDKQLTKLLQIANDHRAVVLSLDSEGKKAKKLAENIKNLVDEIINQQSTDLHENG